MNRIPFLLALLAATMSCTLPAEDFERLRPDVISERRHDPGAFTQGYQFYGDFLYESTGQYGQSTLREMDPRTMEFTRVAKLPDHVFGEGLAVVDDHIYVLTWREQLAIKFSRETFQPVKNFHYEGEGWGLAYDGENLIMSDGTSRLTWRDPETFDIVTSVTVTLQGSRVQRLNELEYVDGEIWANVWMTENILRIDPKTGKVTGVVDCRGLLTPEERQGADVLNGIAYNPATRTFLITGKLWPKAFEVIFVPAE